MNNVTRRIPARQITYLTMEISVELNGRGLVGICVLDIRREQQFPSVNAQLFPINL
jgi:hypothetical protein